MDCVAPATDLASPAGLEPNFQAAVNPTQVRQVQPRESKSQALERGNAELIKAKLKVSLPTRPQVRLYNMWVVALLLAVLAVVSDMM